MFDKLAGKLQSASLIVIVPAVLICIGFVVIGINTASTENWDHGAWMLILLYFGGGAVLLIALIAAVAYVVKSFKK